MTSDGDLYKTGRNITKKNLKNLVRSCCYVLHMGNSTRKRKRKKKIFFNETY